MSTLYLHEPSHFLHTGMIPAATLAGQTAWSTDGCPLKDRSAYWRKAVCTEFISLDPVPREPGRFFGHIRSRRLGPLCVSTIHSAPQIVQRGNTQILRAPGEFYFLIVQQAGTGIVVQHGRRADLLPGDAAIVDIRRPYTLAFEREFEQLSISIPVACIEARRREGLPTGVRIGNVGPLVAGYLDLFTGMNSPEAVAQSLVNNIMELLHVVAMNPAAETRQWRDRRLSQIQEYLKQHFSDPALSATRVADANHVSVRQLHKLFAARDLTFGACLRGLRLEYGRQRLANPECHATIVTIAMEAGYDNQSCFSRAFRQQFGLTPSEYRAAARVSR